MRVSECGTRRGRRGRTVELNRAVGQALKGALVIGLVADDSWKHGVSAWAGATAREGPTGERALVEQHRNHVHLGLFAAKRIPGSV